MRIYLFTPLLLIVCLLLNINIKAQQKGANTPLQINNKSIVTDSSGQVFDKSVWQGLLLTGEYGLKSKTAQNDTFIIYRMDERQKKMMESVTASKEKGETPNLPKGKKIARIKDRDIEGNKIDTKELQSKIVVLNFWFTTCKPCLMEMNNLNKIFEKYSPLPDVAFISIALEDAGTLKEFLKTHSFQYPVIPNGRYISNYLGINSYPTNVVLDKEGKVTYSSTGLSLSTAKQIRKAIDKLLNKTNEE